MGLNTAKQIIDKAKNITILPSPVFQKDSFPAALALFYTLKDLGKNVNFLAKKWPGRFNFLVDSALLHGSKADFVLTLKKGAERLENLFYQKEGGDIKFFLKTKNNKNGKLTKDDLEIQPLTAQTSKETVEDCLIALGVKDFDEVDKALQEPSSPVINIDLTGQNEGYGEANLISPDQASFSETAFELICLLLGDKKKFNEQTANALTAGILHATNNLQHEKTSHQTLQRLSCLVEEGASLKTIKSELYGRVHQSSLAIFSRLLHKMQVDLKRKIAYVLLTKEDFQQANSSPAELRFALRKLTSGLFPFQNLAILWESYNSPPSVKGVFYSPKENWLEKTLKQFSARRKGEAVIFKENNRTIEQVKEKFLRAIAE